MQTEEPKQFRLNPQVLVVVAVVLLALALPIFFVILSLQTAFGTKPAASSPAAEAALSAPLQKALEDIADKSLNPAGLGAWGDREVLLGAQDPESELVRVESLVKAFGAVSLPAAREGGRLRLRVSLAENQSANFIKACEEKTTPTPTRSPDPARAMVEVVIEKQRLP